MASEGHLPCLAAGVLDTSKESRWVSGKSVLARVQFVLPLALAALCESSPADWALLGNWYRLVMPCQDGPTLTLGLAHHPGCLQERHCFIACLESSAGSF